MAISGLYILSFFKRIGKISTASAIVDATLIILFTMSMAVCWEFYEFLSDTFLYTHAQASNFDTMKDLFMGTLGAMVFSVSNLVRTRVKLKK